MSVGSNYVECVCEPRGEDATCSDKFKFILSPISYLSDHLHYFDIQVAMFGLAGCPIG
ncbi:hypothetical protein ANCCAN_29061 [Ancylostoma caninum]|uniref:Uncharacterized protein n=1 Tax=Ancylostoma caninum TaxID=29170 RepID=A0A368F0P4_ANCCA|nr:hypothetical protein ANCCAN_29061 [Ancylostoma caninum]